MPLPSKSLWELVLHPWHALARLQGIDRLPDRRVTKQRHQSALHDPSDPLRNNSRVQSLYKAIGVYALDESRTELYENYREMDSDPVIATVMDAFAEDATQRDPDNGRIVWCESANSVVRDIVTATLDRNRVEQWAFPVCRAIGRDGDVLMHLASARNAGILAMRPYEPWTVARIEDEIGRLIGFAPADERGLPTTAEKYSVPHYKVAHFRLPPRELTDHYGAQSSFLWGSRITWREFQLMEDQVVIQRLLRRPDRIMVLMDSTGMSYDEAWMTIKDMERRLSREWHANPAAGTFSSQGTPLDIAKDIVLPRGAGNQTQVENFPATNQNDLLRDVDLILAKMAAGIGFPLGFIGRGDGSAYQAGQSLSRQHNPFAKRASRLQHAFLTELTRVCMIDLAFRNLDPMNPQNAFTLRMTTVSPIAEIERNEVMQLKMDRMERALAFGQNAGLEASVWVPYILEKLGGFSRELIKQIYRGAAPGEEPPGPPSAMKGGDVTYTEAQKLLSESRFAQTPDPGMHVSSTSIPLPNEERYAFRPTKLDEANGTGECVMEASEKMADGMKPAVFEPRRTEMIEARKKRAETRVQLMTTLAGYEFAGA